MFLSVGSSTLVGLVLIVAPWWPEGLWESNYFLGAHTALRAWILSAFTRGAVTGLGIVNIMLALAEARQYLFGRP